MATRYPTDARDAFDTLRRLADALDAPATRAAALDELCALAALGRGRPDDAPLRTQTVTVTAGARTHTLELLLLPSIFAPEAWAFTFLEGLLQVPLEEYAGRRLVEVGAGSGWICLALAKFTRLAHVHGADLNPHAPVVARCNAWLNGDEALVQRLSFGVSDLLLQVPSEQPWDFVVGCIPQVLRAEGLPPDATSLATADAQALYDLSNYTAIQNVYEDHFGLGLIARLLDEAPERLALGGRLLLNLAGRPGRAIIERMFRRRGYAPRVTVARRVEQAADTDIRPLVALEQRTGREFEFFMQAHSAEPIRAATALGWLGAGHPIWHEVAVWEASLRLPRETLALRAALRRLGMQRLLEELDLGDAGQEQLAFVVALAERLARSPHAPYAHEAGDASFRALVVRYLARHFGLHLPEDGLFVAPEREQAVYSLLLCTCDPGDRVLVSRNVHALYARALAKAGVEVTVTNNSLAEVRQLLSAFPVKLALLSVEAAERTNLAALEGILDEAQALGALVVLDESAFFHITSGVQPLTLFEHLAKAPPRPNLVVLYGLIKNAVWPDLELTLLLPVPAALAADLEVAAEVTYSRISTLAEWFYARTFEELLAFSISFEAPREAPRLPQGPLPRSARIRQLAGAPAFAPRVFRPDDPRLVRLDYGENEGALPPSLVEGLLAAAAAPGAGGGEGGHSLREAVGAFLLDTREARYAPDELVLGQGVWPLMHDLAAALRARLGRPPRVFLAAPCYGVLPPTWAAAGAEVTLGPLSALYSRRGLVPAPDAVVVSQPSNPVGAFFPHRELVALARYCVEQRCLLVSDEVFGLVHLASTAAERVMSPVGLEAAAPGVGAHTVLLGGLSKEFAAGGLRLGFLAARDRALLAEVERASLGRVHLVMARAAGHLYAAWARGLDGALLHPQRHAAVHAFLSEMRRDLAAKRALLLDAFPDAPGGAPSEPGGLFVAPRVTAWLGRRSEGVELTPDNLPAVLYARTGVVVNGGDWCADRERVRAVFSLPREKVEAARERVRAFAAALT